MSTRALQHMEMETCAEATAPRTLHHAWSEPINHPRGVLVVDDDPDIAPLVEAALRPFCIASEAVRGGSEAIQRLREHCYGLLVLDLSMEDVHGFDVLRVMRNTPLNRSVPVLILSADGSNEAMARSFGYGADEFVRKPFDICELGMRAFRLIKPFEH